MKTCATCEHYTLYKDRCEMLEVEIISPQKQSCIEHREKVEKKKVRIKCSLKGYPGEYYISFSETADKGRDFLRWLTPDDMKKIMNGGEIEI